MICMFTWGNQNLELWLEFIIACICEITLTVQGQKNRSGDLRWLNRVMQDHEARANDLNRKLIFSFFLLFS